MSNIDFETDQAKVITKTENIRSLADQVERLEMLNLEIEQAEEALKNKKKNHDHLSGEIIPTMMSEMGLSHIKLMDGSSVDVKPNYSANITIANREAAFNWLRNNGLGDIIKNDITKKLKSGSGLETTLASLALRCVLGRISTLPKPNVIVFDEVLGKIANINLDYVKIFFDKIKSMYEIILLITHNPITQDWADKIITIEKNNDISTLHIE